MANKETAIQNKLRVQLQIAYPESRFWRNETGGVKDERTGRFIRFGLCKGSSDIIGIHNGKFVAIEVKTARGRLSVEQKRFIEIVRECGGIAFVARSVEEAIEHINSL